MFLHTLNTTHAIEKTYLDISMHSYENMLREKVKKQQSAKYMWVWVCAYMNLWAYIKINTRNIKIYWGQRSSWTINSNKTFSDTNHWIKRNHILINTIFTIKAGTKDYASYYQSTDRSVSFYQNTSVWLDILDSRSWDQNLVDSNANPRLYPSAMRKPAANIYIYIYVCVCVHMYIWK